MEPAAAFRYRLESGCHISNMNRTGAFLLLFFAAGAVGGAEPEAAENVRQNIGEWIQTQRVQSDEKSRWREEKEVLEQSIDLLENESDLLTARLAELEERRDETADERRALNEQNDALLDSSEETEEWLARLEADVESLRPIFPPPLENQAAALLSRLDRADRESIEPGQRMQTVLGILGEVDRFQRNVTLSRETRELEDGTRREVNTIYLGLAQAYFVDDNGRIAGTGRPAGNGWEWTRNDELSAAVRRAAAVLQNERPAEFVDLPVEIER